LGAIGGKVRKNFQKPLKNPPNLIDLMEMCGKRVDSQAMTPLLMSSSAV
jgi:hypothetical protein